MRMRLIALLAVVVSITAANAQRSLANGQSGASVKNRAIETTKGRQRAEQPRDRIGQPQQQRPGRTEVLDVDKLNKLLQAIDKGWTLPKLGSKEPVGSNFQFKKTCANIYKVRHGACQQLGFGIMCFNYCHEQGEKLQFKCVDTSEQAFCRKANSFDTFLTKYRNDAYKAKTFIHQMASRCFSSSVCNTQAGLLNSTLIDSRPALPNKPNIITAPPQPPTPGPAPPVPPQQPNQPRTRGTPPAIPPTPPPEEELEEIIDEEIERVKNVARAKITPASPAPPAAPTTAGGRPLNIWDRFTIEPAGSGGLTTAKYIPFWQRLLSTTPSPPPTTTTEPTTTTTTPEPTTPIRYTWRPLMVTAPPPPGPERKLTHQLTIEEEEEAGFGRRPAQPVPTQPSIEEEKETDSHPRGESQELKGERGHESGFWSRFQPGRWFQSIHFVTNTG